MKTLGMLVEAFVTAIQSQFIQPSIRLKVFIITLIFSSYIQKLYQQI